MSEFCLSSTTNTNFLSLLISAFIIFLYFIFFLPFLLKLIITVSLLLFTFLTISSALVKDNSSKESWKKSVNAGVLEKMQLKVDENGDEDEFFQTLESLEVCKTVFDTSMIDGLEENPEEKLVQAVESSIVKIPHQDQALETIKLEMKDEKRFGDFLKELDEFEGVNCNFEKNKKEESLVKMNGSNARKEKDGKFSNGNDYTLKIKKAHSQRQSANVNAEYTDNGGEYTSGRRSRSMEHDFGSYGSTRKEKEWKRTLAGKLFEERRHNVEGSEGMDLLWETYEMDSKSKAKIEHYANEEDNDDEEEDFDEEINRPMCCLQAFKFSAGKMNMGVGRRNLVKFSKAVKGFGWLHHVSKQRKKVYNGDTFQFP